MSYPLGSADSPQRPDYYAEPEEREPPRRFRGLLAVTITLLVTGLFAGGAWFAYLQGLRHAGGVGGGTDVPLIRADQRPTKVKPDNPGGMEIPDRDKLIYTQKRAVVEHLLPPPETPMPRPTAPPSLAAAQPEAPQPPAASLPAVPSAAAPSAGAKSSGAAPLGAAAQASPAKAGATRIQLGSVRSEEAARHEWDRLKRTNSDLLGGLSATPIRADLGEKGVFYRIQAGPIADAERICRELNRRNVGCIIAR